MNSKFEPHFPKQSFRNLASRLNSFKLDSQALCTISKIVFQMHEIQQFEHFSLILIFDIFVNIDFGALSTEL